MGAAGLCDEDVAETLAVAGIFVVKELEAVHVFEIEADGAFASVDFEGDVVLASERKPGGFEIGECSVLESTDEQRRIVHGDFAHLSASLASEPGTFSARIFDGTFLDESVHQAANFAELAYEVTSKVDDMGVDIAVCAAAADTFLQTPNERKIGIDDPVLRIAGVVMEQGAEGAFFDHPFGVGDGWNAAVIVADHVDHLGLFGGGEHFLALRHGECERFLAEDMFAVLSGGNGDLRVGIVGRIDVDDVDVGIFDDRPPICGGRFPAKLGGGGFNALRVPSADGAHFHICLEWEEVGGLAPRVGVRFAHETVTDHSYPQRFGHKMKKLAKVEVESGSAVLIVTADFRVNEGL